MRIVNVAVATMIALAFVAASAAPAVAQDKKKEDKKAQDAKKDDKKKDTGKAPAASAEWLAYVAYVNGVAKATKIEEVYQYLSTDQLEMYKSIKPALGAKVLQDLKDTMTAQGAFSGTMHLVREENEPKAMYLVLESTTPKNVKIQGRVMMVHELGWVKVGSAIADEDWHIVK